MNTQADLTSAMRAVFAEPGARVLIVGARSTNFPQRMREADNLVIWERPEGDMRASVPASAKLVIFTRFVSHIQQRMIEADCHSGARIIKTPYSTGRIRQAYVMASGIPEARVRRGDLKAFVKTHANFQAKNAVVEIERLHVMASAGSIQTTIGSLGQSFYKLRNAQMPRAYIPQASKEKTPALAVKTTSLDGRLSESVSHLKQFALQLKAFSEQAQLSLIAIDELCSEVDRLRSLERKLIKVESAMKAIMDDDNAK